MATSIRWPDLVVVGARTTTSYGNWIPVAVYPAQLGRKKTSGAAAQDLGWGETHWRGLACKKRLLENEEEK